MNQQFCFSIIKVGYSFCYLFIYLFYFFSAIFYQGTFFVCLICCFSLHFICSNIQFLHVHGDNDTVYDYMFSAWLPNCCDFKVDCVYARNLLYHYICFVCYEDFEMQHDYHKLVQKSLESLC